MAGAREKFTRYKEGDQASASEENRKAEALEGLLNVTGADVVVHRGGVHFRRKAIPAEFEVRFGVLAADWSPGDSNITLTPCASATVADPTGEPNVPVFVQFPISRPPPAFGAAAGEILAYVTFPGGDGEDLNLLIGAPLLPKPANIHEVLQNASSDPDAPHWVAQYPQGHA